MKIMVKNVFETKNDILIRILFFNFLQLLCKHTIFENSYHRFIQLRHKKITIIFEGVSKIHS